MPTRALLLRHAETDRPTIFHGYESDADLSDRGRRQAVAVAGWLAEYRPSVVYSSGMSRARLTAAPIAAACAAPHRVEELLHERKVGELVGTLAAVETGLWPETLRAWLAGDTAFTGPGAESYDDVRERVLPVWARLTAAHPDETVVVVSHGLVIKVLLLSLLEGHAPGDWAKVGRVRNVCVSELVGDHPKWRAERLCYWPPEVEAVG